MDKFVLNSTIPLKNIDSSKIEIFDPFVAEHLIDKEKVEDSASDPLKSSKSANSLD